jgi:hypothetical protein
MAEIINLDNLSIWQQIDYGINLDNLSIWQQIDYGGMAKFHYSIRLFRQQKNKKHVTMSGVNYFVRFASIILSGFPNMLRQEN